MPDAFGVNLVEPRGESLGQPSRVGEHDRAAVRLDQVDDALLDVGPDRVVLEVGHVGNGHLHRQVERLGRGRRDDRRRAPDPTGTAPPPPAAAPSPTARSAGRAVSNSWSSRSSDSARCAPRLVPATACTSSTMTVCTSASVSRAADVSIRNSDSGVVIRMSGGLVISSRRWAGGVSPERTPTLMSGAGSPTALGDPADAGQRACAGCARRRRPAPSAATRTAPGCRRAVGGRGLRRGQPVDGPQERGQRLAGPGRRDDQRVVAVGDGRPRLACAAVGAAKVPVNHSRVSALNRASGCVSSSSHGANAHRQNISDARLRRLRPAQRECRAPARSRRAGHAHRRRRRIRRRSTGRSGAAGTSRT